MRQKNFAKKNSRTLQLLLPELPGAEEQIEDVIHESGKRRVLRECPYRVSAKFIAPQVNQKIRFRHHVCFSFLLFYYVRFGYDFKDGPSDSGSPHPWGGCSGGSIPPGPISKSKILLPEDF